MPAGWAWESWSAGCSPWGPPSRSARSCGAPARDSSTGRRCARLARRRLGADGAALRTDVRESAEDFYRDALLRIEPVVAEEIGAELPAALETPAVIDRREWIDLNLVTFEQLFDRIEQIMASQAAADTPGRALARIVNRSIGNQQLGFLMAFLARKVLGQYDISLLAATPTARGRLHFVEPNIRATAAQHAATARRVPHLHRPARGDARLRVRGLSLAARRTLPAWWPSPSIGWPPTQVAWAPACAARLPTATAGTGWSA